jgi:fido (protein-threonine AMPylation protein)
MSDTEIKLKLWRNGQTAAERLAANILHLDGFTALDPQCPLGGRDGLKDVICIKNNWKYIGASFFPTTEQTFSKLKKKFLNDLKGVSKNKADGLAFITNQHISPEERNALTRIAQDKSCKAIIYHLERIRVLLDSPTGYGVRLEFLDIEMSREEQLSFFSQWTRIFSEQLQDNAAFIINEIKNLFDGIDLISFSKEIQNNIIAATQSTVALFSEMLNSNFPRTTSLTVESLCMIHSAMYFDQDVNFAGAIRNKQVWIGRPGSPISEASYVPPNPEHVLDLTNKLLSDWSSSFDTLERSNDQPLIINKMAEFHINFLKIHPFFDGNGKIARFLLTQQAKELLRYNGPILIKNNKTYFHAVETASSGDLSLLNSLITQAIYGVENLSDVTK